MSGSIDDTGDWPDDAGVPGAPGVPPAPSVTPGSAPPPPRGAEPRTWSRRGCLVVGGVGALVALVVLGGLVGLAVAARAWLGDKVDDLAAKRQEIVEETGIETGSTDIDHPPQRDISIGACEYDAGGGVRASGTITNWAGDPSDYRVALSFREGGAGSAGAEFGSTVITVEAVEVHTTTSWSASVPARPEGPFTCRIVRIDRWESGAEPPSGIGP